MTSTTTGATTKIADAAIISGLCAKFEALINTALTFDPATRNKMSQIKEVLAIDCHLPTGGTLTVYAMGQDSGIHLFSYCEEPAVTRISGSPLALLRLVKQPSSLAGTGVSLSGSAGLLQTWQTLLQHLEIDWEEAASRVLGDIAGPFAADTVKKSTQWVKEQCKEQRRLLREFITEEIAIVPTRTETDHLTEQVVDMQLDIDRLTAQVNALRQQLSKTDHQ